MLGLSHHKVIYDVGRTYDQMLSIHKHFGKLAQNVSLHRNSCLIARRRTFCGIAGSLLGLYLNSATALANDEEDSNDFGKSANSISNLSRLSIDLWTDDYRDLSAKDAINSGLDNAIIPETVWSLPRDTPIHVDRIRDGIASAIYTEPGAHFNNQNSLIRSAFGLWLGNSVYESGGLITVPPLQFQVASCGGASAERKGLDYCALGSDTLREALEQQILSDKNEKLKSDDANNKDVTSPENGSSSSNATGQAPPPSPALTPVANGPSHSDLTTFVVDLGITETSVVKNPPQSTDGPTQKIEVLAPPVDVLEPPVDVLAPPVDVLAPPVDVLAPPVDVLAPPPEPIVQIEDPQPDPVFSPPPSLRSIPEASTWVMTITGFSLMALAFQKKRRPRFNPVSVIDPPEV